VPSGVETELREEIIRLRAELDRQRRARQHRLEIHRLAASTSGQVTRRGVAEIIAGGASEIFDAGWVIVGFVADEGVVRLVHGPNVPDEIRADWNDIPLDVAVPICEVLRGDTPRWELASRDEFVPWPILVAEAERAGFSALVVEPIVDDQRPAAVIALGWRDEHPIDGEERELLSEFADVARPAFRRAIATESDRHVASTLQSWLLPSTVPHVDRLSLSTIYEPGTDELDVGGDWYDVVVTDHGRTAIIVGDVVGHDIRAAAEMGQIRHVLSSNLARSDDPTDSLRLTDRYFHERRPDTMATALVMVFDPVADSLEIASAGHPAPIVVEPGTAARTLDHGLGPPIGSGLGGYSATIRPFPAGAVVIGYTDGVVERRGTPVDRCVTEFCRQIDHSIATSDADHAVPALTALVRQRATEPARRDDAAAVIVQSHRARTGT